MKSPLPFGQKCNDLIQSSHTNARGDIIDSLKDHSDISTNGILFYKAIKNPNDLILIV